MVLFQSNMKCLHCSNQAKLKFTDKNLCNKCFCKVIEKRVRKYIRLNKLISKDDRLLIVDKVCEYFIDNIIKNLPTKQFRIDFDEDLFLILKDGKINDFVKNNKIDRVIIPWTLDHEAFFFLTKFFEKGFDLDRLKFDKKYIKLFLTVDEKSLIEFCKIKKIRYNRIKDSRLNKELERLVERYPELKYSLGKSIKVLKKL